MPCPPPHLYSCGNCNTTTTAIIIADTILTILTSRHHPDRDKISDLEQRARRPPLPLTLSQLSNTSCLEIKWDHYHHTPSLSSNCRQENCVVDQINISDQPGSECSVDLQLSPFSRQWCPCSSLRSWASTGWSRTLNKVIYQVVLTGEAVKKRIWSKTGREQQRRPPSGSTPCGQVTL